MHWPTVIYMNKMAMFLMQAVCVQCINHIAETGKFMYSCKQEWGEKGFVSLLQCFEKLVATSLLIEQLKAGQKCPRGKDG